MFAGHYAPAFALKTRFPEVPLWQLFLGAQAVDVLFFVLVPLGIEQLTIDPTQHATLALVLGSVPFSHSLVAALGWAAVVALVKRDRAGLVLAAAVASHWFLDLLVHRPDLPLFLGDGPRVGLGLWTHPIAAWALEVGLLALSALWLDRRMQALCALLIIVQTLQAFVVPVPTSVLALGATSEASYFGFALLAWWAERPAGAAVSS